MNPVVSRILIVALVLVILVALALFGLDRYARSQKQNLTALPTRDVVVHDQPLTLLVADTPDTVGPGLSGQETLADDVGLLLVSPDADTRVTMLGMQFALDVVWLDDAGRILAVKENVHARPVPLWYSGPERASAVLELAEGGVQKYGISVGDRIT